MFVAKYIPDRLFGFVFDPDNDREIFFHLGDFNPKGPWPGLEHTCPRSRTLVFNWTAPPPILGEPVDVVLREGLPEGRAQRAARVTRIHAPTLLQGIVESFEPPHGYGFARGTDGVTYHLHKSEMIGPMTPLPGNTVTFFAGLRQGRPRACHVHICGGLRHG